jgi:hypothetical protein
MELKLDVDAVFKASFWRTLCPHLSVGQRHEPDEEAKQAGENDAANRKSITEDGFVKVGSLCRASQSAELARGVALLVEYGWPATFILVFDQTWELVDEVSSLMKRTTGNENNLDILAWHIDPREGETGFSPHRDRSPDDPTATFRADKTPRYSSAWVALTEAHERNSCLHMIPMERDPGYLRKDACAADGADSDSDGDSAQDSFEYAERLACKQFETMAWAYFSGADRTSAAARSSVRVLRCAAGDAVLFSHRVLHWGSKARHDRDVGRVVCTDGGDSCRGGGPIQKREKRQRKGNEEHEQATAQELPSPLAPAVPRVSISIACAAGSYEPACVQPVDCRAAVLPQCVH